MPIADNKKAQAIRNLWYNRVAKKILEANLVVATIRSAIADKSLGSEFSTAEKNAMQTVETDLINLAGLSGVTSAESKYQKSHGNHSLIITGVND